MRNPSISTEELVAAVNGHLSTPRPDTESFLEDAYRALRATSTSPAAVAEGLIAIGHYYVLAQKPDAGLAPAADAIDAASRSGDTALSMKALRLRAWLLADAGNSEEAVATITRALEMAREAGDGRAECSCWNLLGVFFHQSGQWSAAIKCCERAIELAGDIPERRVYRAVANTNVALAALDLGDVRRALIAAECGVTDQPEPIDAIDADTRAMRELTFARVLIEARDSERAEIHLNRARHYSRQAGTERARLNFQALLATWEISTGHVHDGLSRTREMLAEVRTRANGYLPAMLSSAVRNYEAAGRPDIALKLVRELSTLRKKRQGELLVKQLEQVPSGGSSVPTPSGRELSEKERCLTRKIQHTHRVLADSAVSAALACGLGARRPFRVARLVELFALQQGLAVEQRQSAKLAGLLSDIGMVAVAPTILSKRGSLTRAERTLLDEHARHGAELVEQVGLEEHQAASELIRLHHEMWDGSGPNGLAGAEIPIEVRILTLCDSFESMIHDRPSRPGISVAAALQDIEAASGKHFDPHLALEFAAWVRREYWKHRDFRVFLGEEGDSNDLVRAKEQIARYVQNAPGDGEVGR